MNRSKLFTVGVFSGVANLLLSALLKSMYGEPLPPKPPIAASNEPAWMSFSYCAYCGSFSVTLMPTALSSDFTSVAAATQSVKLFGISIVIATCLPFFVNLLPL